MTATPASEPADAGHLRALVETRKRDVEALAHRYRIANIRLFGSVARGDAHPESDVDFLSPKTPRSSNSPAFAVNSKNCSVSKSMW